MNIKGVFFVGMFCCTISMFGMNTPSEQQKTSQENKAPQTQVLPAAKIVVLPYLHSPCGNGNPVGYDESPFRSPSPKPLAPDNFWGPY